MNTAAGPLHGIDEISDEAAHTAQVFYGVTIPLVVLATATYAFRMSKSTRSRSVLSDICITVGYVSFFLLRLSPSVASSTFLPSHAGLLTGEIVARRHRL